MFLYNFLFMCNAFVFHLKKQDIFFRNSCVDFNFISLIHSYVYIALCYQELDLQNFSYNDLAMRHILYSENYHQLFKHLLLKLSRIS